MAGFNASVANRSCADGDPESVIRNVVSQALISITLLLWLTQRKGWPLRRGLVLGALYVFLGAFRGFYGQREASGWILSIYLACLETKISSFIVLNVIFSILGMFGSAISYLDTFCHYALAVTLAECLATFFGLIIMWKIILNQLEGPARETMKDLLTSLTVFIAGVTFFKIIESAFELWRFSIFLVIAFIWYTEGRAGISKRNMFMKCSNGGLWCRERNSLSTSPETVTGQ